MKDYPKAESTLRQVLPLGYYWLTITHLFLTQQQKQQRIVI
jgi:hypothetical protein